jgi:hypothetical protein|nr:MAG TPA: hypothetical protein [Caudoviricetes sp.]
MPTSAVALYKPCLTLAIATGTATRRRTYAGNQYTTPASWVSDTALNAFCEVFVSGETFTDIGNATVFYNPQIAGHSEYHEGQIYVCSIGDVKYFEEL